MTGHSWSEWAAVLSLGLSAVGLLALALAFADATLAYFDPRRLLDTDLGARAVVAVFNVLSVARDFCRDAAALLILLTTSPKGAMA